MVRSVNPNSPEEVRRAIQHVSGSVDSQGTALSAIDIRVSAIEAFDGSLTPGRMVLVGAGPVLSDSSTLTYDGTILTASAFSGDGSRITSVIHSETDPVFIASPAHGITSTNITDWNIAYARVETDPVFVASPAYGITSTNITNWNTAYSWGNHALAGYLKVEADPVFVASAAYSITTVEITDWNTAYGWGNHAAAGYLKVETDPVFVASAAYSITTAEIGNWNTAYSWGNHALAGYLTTTGNASNLTNSSLTSGRVVFSTTSGKLTDSSNLTFDGTTLSVSGYPAQRLIPVSTTFYVSPSGNDSSGDGSIGNPWKTIAKSLSFLSDKLIAEGSIVTILLNDGVYAESVTVNPHVNGSQIIIQGKNTYVKNITSVASVTGSSGAWSYVLNLSDALNVSVNDYVCIEGTSGGSNPLYLPGFYQVTAVSQTPAQITVSVPHPSATSASGAVAGKATVIKSSIQPGVIDTGYGVWVTTLARIRLQDLGIVGARYSYYDGIFVDASACCICSGHVGISNFNHAGINATLGTLRTAGNADRLFSSNSKMGLIVGFGVLAVDYAYLSACTFLVYACSMGWIDIEDAVLTGGTYGIYAICEALANVANSSIVSCTIGVYATGISLTEYTASVTFISCGTNTSPAIDTIGNNGSLCWSSGS